MIDKTHRTINYIFLFSLLSAAALLLGACQARELSFETIVTGIHSGSNLYEGRDPKLIVFTNPEQVRTFKRGGASRAEDALEVLDYDRYFAIAVLQGKKGTTAHSVQIESLKLKNKTITIQASSTESAEVAGAGNPSSYHLVKVPREGLQGTFEFILEVDGENLQRETQSLP